MPQSIKAMPIVVRIFCPPYQRLRQRSRQHLNGIWQLKQVTSPFSFIYTMKFAFLVQKLGIILFLASLGVFAQKASIRDPKQEKLLNGLKVLMWSDPSADKVAVKIRVHSGSAFDPQ